MRKPAYLYILLELLTIITLDLHSYNKVFHLGIPEYLTMVSWSGVLLYWMFAKGRKDQQQGKCYYSKLNIIIFLVSTGVLWQIKYQIIQFHGFSRNEILVTIGAIYFIQLIYILINHLVIKKKCAKILNSKDI